MHKSGSFIHILTAASFLTLSACGSPDSRVADAPPAGDFMIAQAVPTARPSSITQPPANPPTNPSQAGIPHVQRPVTNPARLELKYENMTLPTQPMTPTQLSAAGIMPGHVQLVYKESYEMRIDGKKDKDKKPPKLKSKTPSEANRINNILKKHGVMDLQDMSAGMTDSQMVADRQLLAAHYNGEIPDRRSIQTYTLPQTADVVGLCKELRTLSSVRSANLRYDVQESAFTKQLLERRMNINENSSTATGDQFSTYPGSEWWYNRQKVFQAWSVFGSTTLPTLAIIDTGFDTRTTAMDRPNYVAADARGYGNCSAVNTCNSFTVGLNGVTEPLDPVRDYSHGTSVAGLAAAPRGNGQHLAGVAPGAAVVPIRVTRGDDFGIATGIRHARSLAAVDAINISATGNGNRCPLTYSSDAIRTEVSLAIAAGKNVIITAGNAGVDISDPANCGSTGEVGAIIVGGTEQDPDVVIKGWDDGAGGASNYETQRSPAVPTKIDIAAAAANVRVVTYDPDNTADPDGYSYIEVGTSLAAPMVTATAGMMKRLGVTSPAQVRSILRGTADFYRYTGGGANRANAETRFIGYNLPEALQPFNQKMIGVRNLNVWNALVVAKHARSYNVIARASNTDDEIWATVNTDWTTGVPIIETYGNTSFWGINGLVPGNIMNFVTYNASGGYAFDYQVFRNSQTVAEYFGGVVGVTGVDRNASKPSGWYDWMDYAY